MSIKLIPPREGFSPFFYGRGTHLSVFVNRSTKTGDRALARKVIKSWEQQIESGEFGQKVGPTFASAALSYMQAGGDRTYLKRLLDHFKEMPLKDLDQAAVDGAAVSLYPNASAATRNRQVYTPVSAVLRHAGKGFEMKRPKGAQGRELRGWLREDGAYALLQEALKLDAEFGIYLTLLLYTGCRLSEPLKVTCEDLNLTDAELWVGRTKNGEPRRVFLPPTVVAALANHPRGLDRRGERLFRFTKGGNLYGLLKAAAAHADVELPERQAFHLLRHTFGTWMRRYAGMDAKGLVATGAWKSEQAASRYQHAIVNEESQKANLLPAPKKVG